MSRLGANGVRRLARRVVDGRPFLMPGVSGKVSFRLLHVFEVKDGKIALKDSYLKAE